MLVKGRILHHDQVAQDIYLLSLYAPEIAMGSKAGQFIHIRCCHGFDPLLRRPFSLSDIDRETGAVSIIYEVRGKGTKLLSGYPEGHEVDIMGPLGKGFSLEDLTSMDQAILVGGGIGAPPMAALAQALADKGLSKVTIILGGTSKNKLLPEEIFAKTGAKLLFATDDGGKGHKGFVTELLPQLVQDQAEKYFVFACGPEGMLKAVSDYCIPHHIPCQLSLEEIMACGIGACQGCVCKVKGETGFDYVRVCREGPVFEAREVVWDE